MRCPKCQSLIADDVKFCNYCGTPQNNNYQNNYNQNYYQNNRYIKDDEDYVREYVGDNYESFKHTKFNFLAFFFNMYYFLYRKCYLEAIAWFFITIIVAFIGSFFEIDAIAGTLLIILRIIIGINFNNYYLGKAKNKVEQIKQQNPDKSNNEIIEICRRKGKTSVAAPLIAFIIQISLITLLIIIAVMDEDFDDINFPTTEKTIIDDSRNSMNDTLFYQVPEEFEYSDLSEEDIKFYNYFDEDTYDNCSITIEYYDTYNIKSGKEFLEKYTYPEDSNIIFGNITLNNYEWDTYNEKSTYISYDHYSTIYGNYIYYIKYEGTPNSNVCDKYKNVFLKSVTFNKKINTRGSSSV